MPATILIRGAGDLASGVAARLFRSGLNVVMTELPEPLAVRRTVSFAEAVYEGRAEVEGIMARRVDDAQDSLKILTVLSSHHIPVLIDPAGDSAGSLHPLVIVDGRMAKRPPEPLHHSALMYIGLGPGFRAPENCHAVIETERGHYMGRVIWHGGARRDSARPDGDPQRVLRAEVDGVMTSSAQIGQRFEKHEVIARIGDSEVRAPFRGVLRGLLRPGLVARRGMKIGDLDARDDPQLCTLVSDKSLAIGGAVLEAMLTRAEVRSRLWP